MTDGVNSAERLLSHMDFSCIGGAVVTQEYIDSIWDIHKYAIPTLVSDDNENRSSHYSYEEEMALFGKLLNGEVTAADFAAKWDEMNDWAEPVQ